MATSDQVVRQVDAALREDVAVVLVIDLADVTFIDSSGIGNLLRSRRTASPPAVPSASTTPRRRSGTRCNSPASLPCSEWTTASDGSSSPGRVCAPREHPRPTRQPPPPTGESTLSSASPIIDALQAEGTEIGALPGDFVIDEVEEQEGLLASLSASR